jgi:hypothetical protein
VLGERLQPPGHGRHGVGFVNSVALICREIRNPRPPALRPQLGRAADDGARFERVREPLPVISRGPLWLADDGEGSPSPSLLRFSADAQFVAGEAARRVSSPARDDQGEGRSGRRQRDGEHPIRSSRPLQLRHDSPANPHGRIYEPYAIIRFGNGEPASSGDGVQANSLNVRIARRGRRSGT